jgi:hypothetical protein
MEMEGIDPGLLEDLVDQWSQKAGQIQRWFWVQYSPIILIQRPRKCENNLHKNGTVHTTYIDGFLSQPLGVILLFAVLVNFFWPDWLVCDCVVIETVVALDNLSVATSLWFFVL